jgi:membrane protease subunit HflC
MGKIREQMTREGENFGIQVVDVRIRRADLPDANSQAVFQRMQTQIQREAAEIRAGGNQLAQTIRAKADREVTVTVAEEQSRGEQIRGEGDGTRNKIFADAYSQDRDFFEFYRTMQAYEHSLKQGTNMLLAPDSEFMRYFNDAAGKPANAPR